MSQLEYKNINKITSGCIVTRNLDNAGKSLWTDIPNVNKLF